RARRGTAWARSSGGPRSASALTIGPRSENRQEVAMRRIRLLPEWYERSLLWDVSEMVQPLGIRVRTMATPPCYYDFFPASIPWNVPMHTVELCGLLLNEIPELAEEEPEWPRRMRLEANI